jgi:hypothetical protein
MCEREGETGQIKQNMHIKSRATETGKQKDLDKTNAKTGAEVIQNIMEQQSLQKLKTNM